MWPETLVMKVLTGEEHVTDARMHAPYLSVTPAAHKGHPSDNLQL